MRLSSVVGASALTACVQAGQWIAHQTVNGIAYPYSVHLPDGTPDNPPALLFLSGKGSRLTGDPQDFVNMPSWNGPGVLIQQYNSGVVNDDTQAASNDFVLIYPFEQMTGDDGEYNITRIKPTIDDARTHYQFGDVFLGGYSMGARAAWPELLSNTSYYAASAIAAGVPTDTTGFDALAPLHIHHYAGTSDTEAQSNVQTHQNLQNIFTGAGSTTVVFDIVQGINHEDMGKEGVWNKALFDWLLQFRTSYVGPSPSGPSSGSGSGSGSSGGSSTGSNTQESSWTQAPGDAPKESGSYFSAGESLSPSTTVLSTFVLTSLSTTLFFLWR